MLDKITTTTINVAMQVELRDWFAGMALQGMLAGFPGWDDERVATLAYTQADAMLAARKQTDTTQGTP